MQTREFVRVSILPIPILDVVLMPNGSDLLSIDKALRKMKKVTRPTNLLSRAKSGLLSSVYKDEIIKCAKQLDWALNEFRVSCSERCLCDIAELLGAGQR